MRDALNSLSCRLAERQMHIDEMSERVRNLCKIEYITFFELY